MNLHEFIFTDKPGRRYYRHVLFWSVRYLFILIAAWMNTHLLDDGPPNPAYGLALAMLGVLGFEMLYTYVVAYYMVPKLFLQKKKFAFFTAIILYSLLMMVLSTSLDQYINHPGVRPVVTFFSVWSTFWGYTGYGPPSVCALFLVVRMLKLYYKKVEEKEVLLRENANAESQLLKARVHPHFLFNTLNNIYSYSFDRPADAARLAENLSGTLHYMIKDCEAILVPLDKELKMISDYVQLEKVRYGNGLRIDISIEGDASDKMIAPLLMIPFIENAFKHGASQMMEGSWIKMRTFISKEALHLEVSNNKPFRQVLQNDKGGIGLNTVRKRLELLYPGNHQLKIDGTSETFRTFMQVPLQLNTIQLHDVK